MAGALIPTLAHALLVRRDRARRKVAAAAFGFVRSMPCTRQTSARQTLRLWTCVTLGTIPMCLQVAQPAPDDVLHLRGEPIRHMRVHPYAPWNWYAPYPGYWYSPCYPLATCNPWLEYRLLERRLQRAEDLRRGPPAHPPASALPYGLPGPESELRPEYRDSGKVRPEYEGSGQFRPEFLEERERRSSRRN